MAAYRFKQPPIDPLPFTSIFLIREITPKKRVFWTPHVGAHTKNERISEKFRVYMVGIFFDGQGTFSKPDFCRFLGKWPKTPQKGAKKG